LCSPVPLACLTLLRYVVFTRQVGVQSLEAEFWRKLL
jgi:hypothetical protein